LQDIIYTTKNQQNKYFYGGSMTYKEFDEYLEHEAMKRDLTKEIVFNEILSFGFKVYKDYYNPDEIIF
jgi:hypothetical protein